MTVSKVELYFVTPARKTSHGFGNAGTGQNYTFSEISHAAQKAKNASHGNICYDGQQGGFICCEAGAQLLLGLREVASVRLAPPAT